MSSSQNNNTSTLDASHPSLCIPRTFSNIRWMQVKAVFEQLFGEGSIARVDVVRKTASNRSTFNCMFIHFNAWPTDEYSQSIRQNILDGKTIKVVYDEPWYWKCSQSRLPRPEKKYIANRPYIASEAGASASEAGASEAGASASEAGASASEAGASEAGASASVPLERPKLKRSSGVL